MAIPSLTSEGLLPPGIHQCVIEEIGHRFGPFQNSDRRPWLFQQLTTFLNELRPAGIARAVIVDGSFVTAQPAPNDIDIIVVLPRGHDFSADLPVDQYNLLDSRRARRLYGLDVFIAEEGSDAYLALIRFYQRVRLQPGQSKGIMQINL